MPTSPMVKVATVGDPIEARIIAARLGSEGVLWELRGGVDGPYPVGPFHVYVPEPDLATARAVLTPADDELDVEPRPGRAPLALWFVVLAIVALALFGIARVAMTSDACMEDGTAGTVRCADVP